MIQKIIYAKHNGIFNREGVTDTDFHTRTLRFELIDDNSTKPLRTNPYEYNRIIGRER